MAMTLSSVLVSPLPGGQVLVHGLMTGDASYATGGEVADLSDYIKSAATNTTFRLFISGDDGYVPQSDRGTAAANKVLIFEAGADGAGLDETSATTNHAATIMPFVAIGPAY